MLRILPVFLLLTFSVYAKNLPKYLIPFKCPQSKDFKDCFINSANKAIPLVARGDAEYHIPNLMPLELPFFQLISSPSLNLNVTNIKVYGLEKLKLVDIRIFWEKTMYTSIFTAQNITIDGNYTVDGQVMIMPIKGSGHFSMRLTNGTFKVTVPSKIIKKNGDDYFKLDDFRLDYNVKKLNLQFDNLFEGNKQLGDQLNKFLNENWDLILTDFGPGIAKTVSDVIKNVYEQFAADVPVKYYFKE